MGNFGGIYLGVVILHRIKASSRVFPFFFLMNDKYKSGKWNYSDANICYFGETFADIYLSYLHIF